MESDLPMTNHFLCTDVIGEICDFLSSDMRTVLALRSTCKELMKDIAYHYPTPLCAADCAVHGLARMKLVLAAWCPDMVSEEAVDFLRVDLASTLVAAYTSDVKSTSALPPIFLSDYIDENAPLAWKERKIAESEEQALDEEKCVDHEEATGTGTIDVFLTAPPPEEELPKGPPLLLSSDCCRYTSVYHCMRKLVIPTLLPFDFNGDRSFMNGHPRIEELDLSQCNTCSAFPFFYPQRESQDGDLGMYDLLQILPSLRKIVMPPQGFDTGRRSFLVGCPQLEEIDLTTVVPDNEGTIGRFFLSFSGVRSASFPMQYNTAVTQIERYFFSHTKKLRRVDLTNLSSVKSIGTGFLAHSGITELDLSPLQSLEDLEGEFLCGCEELESLDLSPLQRLAVVSDNFLVGCTRLRQLEAFPLYNLQTIDSGFLSDCSSLVKLDFGCFDNCVTRIGHNFLSGCSSLRELVLPNLSRLQRIEHSFLGGCTSLESVDLSTVSSNLTSIDLDFLRGCRSLKSIDLTPFRHVASIGSGFLRSCTGLVEIDLTPLKKLTSFDEGWLMNCSRLKQIIGLSELVDACGKIPSGFLWNCKGLQRIHLALKYPVHIGLCVMAYCTGLNRVEIGMEGAKTGKVRSSAGIGDFFLVGCRNLTHLDIQKVPLKAVGTGFLLGCTKLKTLSLDKTRENWRSSSPLQDSVLDHATAQDIDVVNTATTNLGPLFSLRDDLRSAAATVAKSYKKTQKRIHLDDEALCKVGGGTKLQNRYEDEAYDCVIL